MGLAQTAPEAAASSLSDADFIRAKVQAAGSSFYWAMRFLPQAKREALSARQQAETSEQKAVTAQAVESKLRSFKATRMISMTSEMGRRVRLTSGTQLQLLAWGSANFGRTSGERDEQCKTN